MNPLGSLIRPFATSSILQQAGWLGAAKIVQGVCSITATFFVARHLAPTVFGELSLAIAMASVVASAAALGLEQIATRELAATAGNVHPVLRVLHRIRIAGALLGLVILAGAALFPSLHPAGTASLLLILSLLPLAQVGDVCEWRLVAEQRGRIVAMIALATAPLAALARLGLVFLDMGVVVFAWALVIEWGTRSALLFLVYRSEPGRTTGGDGVEFRSRASALLRDSMPLLMAGLAVFAYMRIDQFMIAAYLGPEQVGLYSAAVVLAEAPLILPVLILRAALPRLTRESNLNKGRCDETLVRLMRHVFYLHLAGAAFVSLFAQPITLLLYGADFGPAATVLRIQAWGAPFVALGVMSGAWIVLNNRTPYALWRTLAGASVNIGLNLVLIPSFGIAGAAFSTVIAFATATLLSDAFAPSTRPLLKLKMKAMWIPLWRAR